MLLPQCHDKVLLALQTNQFGCCFGSNLLAQHLLLAGAQLFGHWFYSRLVQRPPLERIWMVPSCKFWQFLSIFSILKLLGYVLRRHDSWDCRKARNSHSSMRFDVGEFGCLFDSNFGCFRINMFAEKLYIVIWFWLLGLSALNAFNLIHWLWCTHLNFNNTNFIDHYLVSFLGFGLTFFERLCL